MADVESQVPYQMQKPMSIKDAESSIRNNFVRKVYGILTAQLLLTIVVAAPFQLADRVWLIQNQWILMIAVIMTFVTICAIACPGVSEKARQYPGNYIFLFTFTACEGVVIGFVSAQYTWQSVLLAAGLTAAITFCMTLYACFTKTDFTGAGPYLFGALMALSLSGFVLCVLSACFGVQFQQVMVVYDVAGVMIFTLYLVFDTQKMLGGHHKTQFSIDDYVFAALNLYLDIINIFLYILQLIGDKK